jgi:arabinose-5-phosphate isomerase
MWDASLLMAVSKIREYRKEPAVENPFVPRRVEALHASRRFRIIAPMDYLERARRVFEIELSEAAATAARLDAEFVKAVDLIKAAVERRNKVVVLGVGKSGNIGEKIAATLTSTGSTAVVLNSLNALHGDLGIVAEGDIVLALSYSGETQELLSVLPAIVRMDLPIIAITGDKTSSLAKVARAVLDVSVSQEACPLNLAPTSSTTSMLVLGDALAMVLLESRGFRKEDFAKFHPGGSLGRSLLMRVHQIMRPVEELALIPPAATVVEAIQAMTSHRAGAAIVVHADGSLAGIFTQGDFARQFPGNPGIGSRPVGDFMTLNPITIGGDRLAAEVLQILEHHRIDDLVVLDEMKHPIGVVDSQDLTRLKIL